MNVFMFVCIFPVGEGFGPAEVPLGLYALEQTILGKDYKHERMSSSCWNTLQDISPSYRDQPLQDDA